MSLINADAAGCFDLREAAIAWSCALRCVLGCVFTVTFLRMQNEDRAGVGVGHGRLRVNNPTANFVGYFSPHGVVMNAWSRAGALLHPDSDFLSILNEW